MIDNETIVQVTVVSTRLYIFSPKVGGGGEGEELLGFVRLLGGEDGEGLVLGDFFRFPGLVGTIGLGGLNCFSGSINTEIVVITAHYNSYHVMEVHFIFLLCT